MVREPRLDDLTYFNAQHKADCCMIRVTLGALALALPVAASAAPENYTLDPYHTYPHFAVDHFGVSLM